MNTTQTKTVFVPVKVEDELPEIGKEVFTLNNIIEEKVRHLLEDDGKNISINSRVKEIPNKCEKWFDEHNFHLLHYKVNTWLKEQEGFFFTSEQLNQFVSNIIKDTLETAAEKAEWDCDIHHENITVDKGSILYTFEQTFNKHKV